MKKERLQPIKDYRSRKTQDIIDEELRMSRNAYKRSGHYNTKDCDSIIEFESPMRRRRSKAIDRTMERVLRSYPDSAADWARLNAHSFGYADFESENKSLILAAIWILDHIVIENSYDELYSLLPHDPFLLDELYSTYDVDYWDSKYSVDLVDSVLYVIYNRNNDIVPHESNTSGDLRLLTNALAAEGRHKADVPSRQVFEKLLALIPQEDIDKAVSDFKRYYESYTKQIMSVLEVYEHEHEEYRQKANELIQRINKLRDEIEKPIKKKPLVSVQPLPGLGSIPMPFGYDEKAELMRRHTELCDRFDDLVEKMNNVIHKKCDFIADMNFCGHVSDLDPDVSQLLTEDIPMPDIYTMCFALLYLIETDDDIPWLYGSCLAMMSKVAYKFPWSNVGYEELEDEVWQYEKNAVKPVDIPDWYEREYASKDDPDFPISLAQLLYEETGCIMPRDLHKYDCKAKMLGQYGIRRNNALSMLYCMNILGSVRRQDKALNLDYSITHPVSDDSGDDKELIQSLQNEIRQLKSALHNAEKQATESKKKIAEIKKSAELEHRELADLREIIFNADNDTVDETVSDESIFPYTVQRNTVVFGGHDAWSKEIKLLLNGEVRFIQKGMIFDTKLIRYADIIWIQSNAIPHRQYYSIINEVRKYNKPVRYFQYASAMKCAEQVVENDRE